MVDFRMRCPHLETIIVPGKKMWVFRESDDIPMGWALVFIGTIKPKGQVYPSKDLPPPK